MFALCLYGKARPPWIECMRLVKKMCDVLMMADVEIGGQKLG